MKIGVIGEMRMPVLPYGPGGLGRTTHMLATALLERGHEVTLHATSCEFTGRIACHEVNPYVYDVILDMTHDHNLSRVYPNEPIVNLILDRECRYLPPQAVVETEYMQGHYPSAKITPAGIDVDSIPFTETPGDYLVFMGLKVAHKQPEVAEEVAKKAGMRLVWICPPNDLTELQKFAILGAVAHLAPYTIDAGPRSPLEAAACGTPTICLDGDGTKEHVHEGLTGFICKDADNMAQFVQIAAEAKDFQRKSCRLWVEREHDIKRTIVLHEQTLEAVAGGARW